MVFSLDKAIEEGSAAAGAPEVVRIFTAGVVAQDAVYQKNDGKVDRADASALATAETFIGFVIAINDPNPGECRIRIHGDLDGFSGLVKGETYILASSPGQIVGLSDTGNGIYPTISPPGSGHVMREVGNAVSITKLFMEPGRDFELL